MADSITDLMMRLAFGNSPGLAGLVRAAVNPQAGNSANAAPTGNQRALANAALAAAGAMLTPNLSRYPIGAMQRIGLGLGAGLQALRNTPMQFPQTVKGPARAKPAVTSEARIATPGRRTIVLRSRSKAGTATPHLAANRRRHTAAPVALGGGWSLYGYEKRSGKPVYIGPDRVLRVYE